MSSVLTTREGLSPADNERFLRLWYEVSDRSVNQKWFPYQKGGTVRKWYGNNEYYVNWQNDGYEIKNNIDTLTGRVRSHNYNGEYAFLEGLSWSAISTTGIGFRYVPAGYLFDSAGSMGFCNGRELLFYTIGLLNSVVAKEVFSFISPTIKFMPGHIVSVPFILSEGKELDAAACVKSSIELSKEDWDSFETSWDFKKHPLI